MNENQDQNINNSNNFTNDYNQPIPTNNSQQSQMVTSNENLNQTVQTNTTIIETPIVFEEQQPVEVVADVIPTFDTSVLEELPDDLKPASVEEPLINSMTKETQQEKEQHKKNLIFIAILFAVLIFAVVVIFPMLLDI